MDIAPDIWVSAAFGIVVVFAAVGNYIKNRQQKSGDPLLTGVAAGFVNHDQMERLIRSNEKIATHLQGIHGALTDKNAANINDRLDDLTEMLAREKGSGGRR